MKHLIYTELSNKAFQGILELEKEQLSYLFENKKIVDWHYESLAHKFGWSIEKVHYGYRLDDGDWTTERVVFELLDEKQNTIFKSKDLQDLQSELLDIAQNAKSMTDYELLCFFDEIDPILQLGYIDEVQNG